MTQKIKKILILSSHVDDAELGMGGTIAKLADNADHQILLIAFSAADNSLLAQFHVGTLEIEADLAAEELGLHDVDHHEVRTLEYNTRYFSRDRQNILEDLIVIKREFNPNIVYCPNYDDMHQDHKVLAEETMRAFKHKTLLMYQMPWNSRSIKLQFISILNEDHMLKKVKALAEFKSQARKRYMKDHNIIAQARTFGLVIDTEYAEAFEVVRYVDD